LRDLAEFAHQVGGARFNDTRPERSGSRRYGVERQHMPIGTEIKSE